MTTQVKSAAYAMVIGLCAATGAWADTKPDHQRTTTVAAMAGAANNICPAGKSESSSMVKKDLESATLQHLEDLARRGNADAMVALGIRYAAPHDGEPEQPAKADFAKSFALFESASKKGNAIGEYFVGVSLMSGSGTDKDEAKAFAAFKKAASKGVAMAQFWAGEMTAKGRGGVARDPKAALTYFVKAATGGAVDSFLELGLLYENGVIDGAPAYEKAAYCYRQGIAMRSPLSEYNLRSLIDQRKVVWQEGDPGKPLNP